MSGTPGFNERVVRDLAAGEIRDGDIRYLMLRSDALMGVLKRLEPQTRLQVLAAFKDTIVEKGGRSAESYRRSLPPGERANLLDIIAATAPQLGWGSWRFTAAGEDGIALEVANSPFAAGYGRAEHAVCHPIAGMLTAVAGMVLGRPADAAETRCAAQHGGGTCSFAAEIRR